MAKHNNNTEFSNPLRFRDKFSNVDVNQKVGRFGQMKKSTADFTFDEMVEFYLNMHQKSKDVFFTGVIPPNYKSPFEDKPFPKNPLENESDSAE